MRRSDWVMIALVSITSIGMVWCAALWNQSEKKLRMAQGEVDHLKSKAPISHLTSNGEEIEWYGEAWIKRERLGGLCPDHPQLWSDGRLDWNGYSYQQLGKISEAATITNKKYLSTPPQPKRAALPRYNATLPIQHVPDGAVVSSTGGVVVLRCPDSQVVIEGRCQVNPVELPLEPQTGPMMLLNDRGRWVPWHSEQVRKADKQ